MSEQLNSVMGSVTIKAIVNSSLDQQREIWNVGKDENYGTSIDVLKVMEETLSSFEHLNKTQVLLLHALQDVDVLKYAKPLHKQTVVGIKGFVARLK